MQQATFTQMIDGTQADYDAIMESEREYSTRFPDRILQAVRELEEGFEGFPIDRFRHSLQSATRAHRDGRDEEYVVAALVHDVGDSLAPFTHSELAAAILRPYVRPELVWIVKHHGIFQLHYYGAFIGEDPDGRERYRGHEWFDACEEFCFRYDQASFDPRYDELPIEFFEPMVRRVFAEPRYFNQDSSRA